MKKIILTALSITVLSACSSNAPITANPASNYNANKQARVRLYGQNQKPTLMWHGIDCNDNKRGTKVNVGGGMGDAFGSLVGTAKSSSIGIPASDISKNIGTQNGILSKAIFREFVVEADKPVNVQASYIGLTTTYTTPTHIITQIEGSCNGKVASFVPQAGHDYEVVGIQGGACGARVYEIDRSGGLTPITLQSAYSCKR